MNTVISEITFCGEKTLREWLQKIYFSWDLCILNELFFRYKWNLGTKICQSILTYFWMREDAPRCIILTVEEVPVRYAGLAVLSRWGRLLDMACYQPILVQLRDHNIININLLFLFFFCFFACFPSITIIDNLKITSLTVCVVWFVSRRRLDLLKITHSS